MNQLPPQIALVITTISEPNDCLRKFAAESQQRDYYFVAIGDEKSPGQFELPGCDFFNIERQLRSEFSYAQHCPRGHYARKNIGYLLAMRKQADIIIESDDDNMPLASFWDLPKQCRQDALTLKHPGWVNIYRYFTDQLTWPRGLPLDAVRAPLPPFAALKKEPISCPIQQGLVNNCPDVDAIHRFILPMPKEFRTDRSIVLRSGAWCPFNSQNTTWFREAFPLLYLPAYCSFRMTDIWRSLVAQRIAWVNDWGVLYHKPTVRQERNAHNLWDDFEDEIPGHLHNRSIAKALEKLKLKPGQKNLFKNLYTCYEALVSMAIIDARELELLNAWIEDFQKIHNHNTF